MRGYVSCFQAFGYVLTLVGMMALVLTGGTFSHAHEMNIVSSDRLGISGHAGHDHSGHHHSATEQTDLESDGSLHCGAPILSLVSLPEALMLVTHRTRIDFWAENLSGTLLWPDPPPPRYA